jgi:hypothetical protein
MRKTLLYATAAILIFIIIVVALVITYYSGSESTFPAFRVKGNINPPYNQAEIVVQYKGDWIGGYSFENSNGQQYFKQELNGTGNMQLIVNRPNNTAPWIIIVLVQGGSYHVQGNLTLSIFLTNGTMIDTVTTDSYGPVPHIVSLTVNMENLTSSH